MSEDIQLSLEEFRKQLQPQPIRALQIMYLALGSGALIFFLIVLSVYFISSSKTSPLGEQDIDIIKLLTIVHIGMAGMEYLIGFVLFSLFVNKEKLKKSLVPLSQEPIDIPPEKRCYGLIATAIILRIATFEGAALFGLIICLLSSMYGVLQQYPIYWLNLFSFALLVLYILITFPTRQKLEEIFLRRFGDPDIYQAI